MKPSDPVTRVKGIGPKLAARLGPLLVFGPDAHGPRGAAQDSTAAADGGRDPSVFDPARWKRLLGNRS